MQSARSSRWALWFALASIWINSDLQAGSARLIHETPLASGGRLVGRVAFYSAASRHGRWLEVTSYLSHDARFFISYETIGGPVEATWVDVRGNGKGRQACDAGGAHHGVIARAWLEHLAVSNAEQARVHQVARNRLDDTGLDNTPWKQPPTSTPFRPNVDQPPAFPLKRRHTDPGVGTDVRAGQPSAAKPKPRRRILRSRVSALQGASNCDEILAHLPWAPCYGLRIDPPLPPRQNQIEVTSKSGVLAGRFVVVHRILYDDRMAGAPHSRDLTIEHYWIPSDQLGSTSHIRSEYPSTLRESLTLQSGDVVFVVDDVDRSVRAADQLESILLIIPNLKGGADGFANPTILVAKIKKNPLAEHLRQAAQRRAAEQATSHHLPEFWGRDGEEEGPEAEGSGTERLAKNRERQYAEWVVHQQAEPHARANAPRTRRHRYGLQEVPNQYAPPLMPALPSPPATATPPPAEGNPTAGGPAANQDRSVRANPPTIPASSPSAEPNQRRTISVRLNRKVSGRSRGPNQQGPRAIQRDYRRVRDVDNLPPDLAITIVWANSRGYFFSAGPVQKTSVGDDSKSRVIDLASNDPVVRYLGNIGKYEVYSHDRALQPWDEDARRWIK